MHLWKWIMPQAYGKGLFDHKGDSDNTNIHPDIIRTVQLQLAEI